MKDGLFQCLGWEPHQIKAREWSTAHGVDIAQRVRSGDLSKDKGIVNRRSDKVGSRHHRHIIIEAIDSCIVTLLEADQQILILGLGQ